MTDPEDTPRLMRVLGAPVSVQKEAIEEHPDFSEEDLREPTWIHEAPPKLTADSIPPSAGVSKEERDWMRAVEGLARDAKQRAYKGELEAREGKLEAREAKLAAQEVASKNAEDHLVMRKEFGAAARSGRWWAFVMGLITLASLALNYFTEREKTRRSMAPSPVVASSAGPSMGR